MIADSNLLDTANHLLDREWDRWHRHGGDTICRDMSPTDLRMLRSVLDDLVDVVARCPNHPVEHLEPMVKRLLQERSFTDYGGGTVGYGATVDDWNCRFDNQVKVVMHVLKTVRERALEQGVWSTHAAPPPMAG